MHLLRIHTHDVLGCIVHCINCLGLLLEWGAPMASAHVLPCTCAMWDIAILVLVVLDIGKPLLIYDLSGLLILLQFDICAHI